MNDKELRKRIEEQVSLEKRAHQHVEDLILKDSISQDVFQKVLNEITPAHYADVVEERSIAKLCGYPLCQNKLTKVSRQKFHISIEKKRIYDITERKCFCTSNCFKASRFVQSQILPDPLWLKTQKIVFKFLETLPKQDISSDDGSMQEAYETNAQLETDHESTAIKFSRAKIHDPIDEFLEQDLPEEDHISKAVKTLARNEANFISDPAAKVTTSNNINIERLCTVLDEWLTFDTYKFFKLQFTADQKEMLRLADAIENKGTDDENAHRSAKEFLQENVEWKKERNLGKKDNSKALILPPIDSKSQEQIRRRIVSQKLKQSFSKVLPKIGISFGDLHLNIFSLLKTFRLTNQNIALQPNQWTVIAATMLQVLSGQDKSLEKAMQSREDDLIEILKISGTSQNEFACLVDIWTKYIPATGIVKDHGEANDCEYDNDALD